MPAYDDVFAANDYVRSTVGARSTNRQGDVITEQNTATYELAMEYFILGDPPAPLSSHTLSSELQPELAKFAMALKKHPVGPCEMMAALAFVHLVEKGSTFPVLRMTFIDGDHVFVVAGTGLDLRKRWQDWDCDTAAICDPWVDHVSLCNKTGMRTWFEALNTHMHHDAEEDTRISQEAMLRQGCEVRSKAAWKYKLLE
jgi:hypothetical protein